MIDALFFTLLLLFTLILLRKTAVTIQFKGFSSGYYKKKIKVLRHLIIPCIVLLLACNNIFLCLIYKLCHTLGF